MKRCRYRHDEAPSGRVGGPALARLVAHDAGSGAGAGYGAGDGVDFAHSKAEGILRCGPSTVSTLLV